MLHNQKETRIRMQQKNRSIEENAKKEWQKELELLRLKRNNYESAERRRHNIACMMLCNESPDMGMHRMRSFGKRYKLNRDGNLWNNMQSLCKTHEFTALDEAQSEKQIRTQRMNLLRAQLARGQPRLGTAMTVSSSVGDPETVHLGRRKSKGSRSKTSMQ